MTRACLCRYPESSPKSRHEKAVGVSAAESWHFSGAEATGWLAQAKSGPCEKKRKSRCSYKQRTWFEKETWEGEGTCRATQLGNGGINPTSPRLREVFTSSWAFWPKRTWVCSLIQGNCCTRWQRNCNKAQVCMMHLSPHNTALRPLPNFQSLPKFPAPFIVSWRWEGEKKIWTQLTKLLYYLKKQRKWGWGGRLP